MSDLHRWFISYRRSAAKDAALAGLLSQRLLEAGHEVFMDTQIPPGSKWAKEISNRINWCEFLVVLLSEESIQSEAVQSEVRLANQRRRNNGQPGIIPVRIAYEGPLGYELEVHLGHYQYILWQGPADNETVLIALNSIERPALAENLSHISHTQVKTPEATPSPATSTRPEPVVDPRILRLPGGTVRLSDDLYIWRAADDSLENSARMSGETIVIKAPRQMGKSSLLIRYLDACREAGKRFAYIDFQRFPDSVLADYGLFLRSLAEQLCARLEIKVEIPAFDTYTCQIEFDCFVTKEIVDIFDDPVTLAFDEVDRLLGRPYQSSFFSMLRGWHNARAEPFTSWEEIDLALVISTEPYLLIAAGDQSPFNVTPPIELQPFEHALLEMLNQRIGQILSTSEVARLYELLGGQPYLTRLALYRLAKDEMSFDQMLAHAADADGPFGDHLRGLLVRLNQSQLMTAMGKVISGNLIDEETYHRLHGGGLVRRHEGRILPANLLYARFFRSLQ